MNKNNALIRVSNDQGATFLVAEFTEINIVRYTIRASFTAGQRKTYWILPAQTKLKRISESEFVDIQTGSKLHRVDDE